MSIVDERGRVFGRFNLIDASVVIVLVLLIPIGYAAYAVFRPAPMRITSVKPTQLVKGRDTRLQITGEHFRPYLRAEVGGAQPNRFLIQTPADGEIVVPDLEPGTYDIALYDEVEEVARMKNAVTIVAPPAPPAVKMQLVGAFVNLDEAAARTITAGLQLPPRGNMVIEVVSAAMPARDLRRVRMGPLSVDLSVSGTWSVPATVRIGCVFNFDNQSCTVNGTAIVPGLVLAVSDTVRFVVDEARADTPGLPMDILVRFEGRQEVLDTMKAGDVDKLAPTGNGSRAARIVTVASRQTVAGQTSLRVGLQPLEVTTQTPDRIAVVEAVVRLVAEPGADGPSYRAGLVKPGALFTFDSPSYVARGSIVRSMPVQK